MIKENKTPRQIDMESPEFNTMTQTGYKWFGELMKLAKSDELYDSLFSAYNTNPDYKDRQYKLKVSLFRLLNGKASYHQGLSRSVVLKLQQIKI